MSDSFKFPGKEHQKELSSSLPIALKPVTPPVKAENIGLINNEIRRATDALGKICSYVAWLHSVDQRLPLSLSALIICDVVLFSIESKEFYPVKFLDTKELTSKTQEEERKRDHWNDIKFQFASSLDKRVLGKAVAEGLGCCRK
jgi:hypothetical protein